MKDFERGKLIAEFVRHSFVPSRRCRKYRAKEALPQGRRERVCLSAANA